MNSFLNHRPGLSGIVVALLLAAWSLPSWSDELKFKLTGDMEVPPVTTQATGEAVLTVNADYSVSGKVTTSGLVASMAHIHIGKAGTAGPVIIPLNRNGDNGWLVPEGSKLSEAQYQAYKAGELYVNVHSAEHKPGEIRGQLAPPMAARPSY